MIHRLEMKKRLVLFILTLGFLGVIKTNAQWKQEGSDIDGEAAIDGNGNSVSLSSDGRTVAIGAPFNDGNGTNAGHVRVYKNISGTWTQQGSDIDGEAAGDQTGYSVSLSSDGSTVAIGAYKNSGVDFWAGHVRIYKNKSGTWTQIGSDIDGEAERDKFGYSISLSGDGSTVAIGAPYNDGNGTDAGHVRVYKNISGNWTQIGSAVDGEAVDDKSGSVSLSSDGSTLAIGAPGNDGKAPNAGHVRVYKNISGTWTQQGSDIDGEAANDFSGGSVSLSSDGSTVAIGAWLNDGNGRDAGHVRIYKNKSGTWTQVGSDIDGENAGDYSGSYVSLSSDGSTVAIGAFKNGRTGAINAGHVRVYKNISGTWTQVGSDIDGEAADDESGRSVSLSSDGRTVAIGAPYNDGNGIRAGHVRIHSFCPNSSIDTITSCGPYTWTDGKTYTGSNNNATDTFVNEAGCDSIVTLHLTILSLQKPTDLFATNITSTTADLGWTENGESTDWDIEWGAEGFTPTGTPAIRRTSNPHTLTRLNRNSSYEFYVRANCDSSTSSPWAGPYSFKTVCEQDTEVYLTNVGFYSSGTNGITSNLPTTIKYNANNPSNHINPGKKVRFKIECFNNVSSGKNLVSAECAIRTTSTGITITDSASGLNNVGFGTAAWSTDEFEIAIAEDVKPGTIITFDFFVTDNITGSRYKSECIDFVVAPLWSSDALIDDDSNPDSKGNNNKIIEPGETIEYLPLLENVSSLSAGSVFGQFIDPNDCPDLDVWDDVEGVSGNVVDYSYWNIKFGKPANIEPGERNMVSEFDFVFDYDKPETYKFEMGLDMAGMFAIFPGKLTLVKWYVPFVINPNSPDAPPCGSVGIDENLWVNNLKITPNPSSGIIEINGNLKTSEEYIITVVDGLGRVIYESTENSNLISKTIDLTSAGKGIYVVRIYNNRFFKSKKILLTD